MIREHTDITEQFAQLFNDTFLLQTNSILGTLAKATVDEYDLILTNPPYVMSGSSNLKDEISKRTPEETANKQKSSLEQHYAISAMGVEGLFMEWIIRALVPGGKAFVVVPDGIMNRGNDKRLRDFILDECNIDAVISLPINTFFTTNKKTYIMAITKKVPVVTDGISEKARQTTPVFTYLCSEIGETRDVYRFDMEQNDLDNAAQLFNVFRGIKNNPATVQKHCEPDKRCKVVNIDEFYNSSHWSVERWWTREEKIVLGIEEEDKLISVEDFASIVDDTASTISEFAESLRELSKKKSIISNSKCVSLADKALFELFIGERLLRKDHITPTGDIPAYSANVFIPFVYTNKSNIADFSVSYVLWGIDGNFDFNVIVQGTEFATTDHCGAIKIKNKNIDPNFLAYMLGEIKHLYGFDRGLRASLTNMKRVELNVPVNASGDFDIPAQQVIAEQFGYMAQMKSELCNRHNQISSINVAVEIGGYPILIKPLAEVLDPVKGKSKYTRKYGDANKGEYPVYSASSTTPLTHIDSFDYDGEYLSWATNGFAGKITVLNGKFSINGDRGLLLPKVSNLDIHYLKYILEPIFRQLAKGRKGDHGEDEFTKLYPSMIAEIDVPIPVDENAGISLLAQQEIAKSYAMIETYRREVLGKIDSLIAQHISY
jgi:restriction endonuclease S subunit/methylase of polypeptide subunit release factors